MDFSFGTVRTFGKGWLFMQVLAGLFSSPAQAVTQEIRASFVPDSANPHNNQFINQTPQSGYCADYVNDCKTYNLSGLRLPLRFAAIHPIEPGAPARAGATLKAPAQWRSLNVSNVVTGESHSMEIRIGALGSQYVLSDTAANLTGASGDQEGHNRLWIGGSWGGAPGACQSGAMASLGPDSYTFFWRTPNESACSKGAAFTIPWMSYDYLDVGYELRTPDPLAMSSGLYTGELIYSIAPGGDFDMGDNMLPDNSSLTFRFVLDVQHVLKVALPPGGNRIELVPQGGWQAWLQEGRRPARLFRDQTFNISASSKFKMFFECEHGGIGACALRDTESGSTFPQVYMSVSLPHGITDMAGQPVKHRPLTDDAQGTVFQPGYFLERAPGTLHFEIPAFYLEQMLQPGRARRYAGNVTVIWDSEV